MTRQISLWMAIASLGLGLFLGYTMGEATGFTQCQEQIGLGMLGQDQELGRPLEER